MQQLSFAVPCCCNAALTGKVMTRKLQIGANAAKTASGTVHRAIRLMTVMAEAERALGVSEISQRLGLPISTMHRLLTLLRDEGIVEHDSNEHSYRVGVEFYRISACVTASVSVVQLGQRCIDALSAELDETVALGLYLPEQHAMTFAARADGSHALRYQIQLNRPLPLIWGASGKSILAYLPEDKVAETLEHASPSPTTGKPPPAMPALARELQRIRAAGYVVSFNEKIPGAYGLATPFFGPRGVVGCIGITVPRERKKKYENQRTIASLIRCAVKLSSALGAKRSAHRPGPET